MRGFGSVPGEVFDDLAAEEGAVEVGVELGGADAFVAQHHLYGAQVGAAFEQVGGEGVAEGVGRYVLLEAGAGGDGLEVVEHGDAREAAAAAVAEEEDVLLARADVDGAALVHPRADFGEGAGGDGHKALLAALAEDAQEAFVEKEVAQAEAAQFAYAQPAAVENFHDAVVAPPLGEAEVDGGFEGIDFGEGEDGVTICELK